MPTSVTRRRRSAEDEPRASRYADPDEDNREDAQDGDEDVRPSRRRRAVEEDEDVRPARRRRPAEEDENDEPSPRGRRATRDEDEERPARGRGGSREKEESQGTQTPSTANAGWGAYNKARKEAFKTHDFRPKEEDGPILLKFLDDVPFHTYHQHWVEGLRSTNRRSWYCLRDLGQECPLCDVGDVDGRRVYAAFNVVRLHENAEPELLVWSAGGGIATTLEKRASAKTGPLTAHYYVVTVSKPKSESGRGAPTYEIDVCRNRDLEDEWPEISPLSEKEITALEDKAYDETYFRYPQRSELRKIAAEWADQDD